MNGCVISTIDLSKSYDGKAALRNLRLNVPRGSISGFLGRNGAGKTTTWKLLMGILRPDRFDHLRRKGRTVSLLVHEDVDVVVHRARELGPQSLEVRPVALKELFLDTAGQRRRHQQSRENVKPFPEEHRPSPCVRLGAKNVVPGRANKIALRSGLFVGNRSRTTGPNTGNAEKLLAAGEFIFQPRPAPSLAGPQEAPRPAGSHGRESGLPCHRPLPYTG